MDVSRVEGAGWRRTGEAPAEQAPQVQLGATAGVHKDTLDGQEAATFTTLRGRVGGGAMEQTP